MHYYEPYYIDQVGGGGRGIPNIYVGSRGQRGHGGVGAFLAGLFRRALPFITKGVRTVGREAVKTGINILDDITENNMAFKDSLKNRITESGVNLKRKAREKISSLMEGSGYKGLPVKRSIQSRRGRRRRKNPSTIKKKKNTIKKKPKRLARKSLKKKAKSKKRKIVKKKIFKRRKDIFD